MECDSIHIIFAADNAYVQHLGILLISIFENNHGEFFVIYILADNLSFENKVILSQIVQKEYGYELVFYDMDKSFFSHFPVRAKDHISITAYYRLKLTDLLPENLHKILYLDCDMIVTALLRPLWDTDLNGVALAAVTDILSFDRKTYNRLNISYDYRYFNSGMLLINLDYWKEEDVFSRALEIAESQSDVLLWHDQDILNILFNESWKPLPYRWNIMNTLMRPLPFLSQDDISEIDFEIKNRAIVHYTSWKPWNYPCDNPLRFEYYKYLNLSPWKGSKPKVTVFQRLRWTIHNIRIATGLLKRGYREISL